jgi:hypothetical protein
MEGIIVLAVLQRYGTYIMSPAPYANRGDPEGFPPPTPRAIILSEVIPRWEGRTLNIGLIIRPANSIEVRRYNTLSLW